MASASSAHKQQPPCNPGQRAQELLDAARNHKREAKRHRLRAQAAMRELAELQAMCDRLGIMLVVNNQGEAEGDSQHGPNRSTTKIT